MRAKKSIGFERYATLPQRLLAYNIDLTVFMVFIVPISFMIGNNELLYTVAIVFIVVYHAAMECSPMQATFGKRFRNLKVVDDKFERISFWRALLRIMLKFVSLGLVFGGFFMIYFRKEREGLHDLIMNTRVIEYSEI